MCAIIYISARFLAQGDREFLHNILNKNESESGKELLVFKCSAYSYHYNETETSSYFIKGHFTFEPLI